MIVLQSENNFKLVISHVWETVMICLCKTILSYRTCCTHNVKRDEMDVYSVPLTKTEIRSDNGPFSLERNIFLVFSYAIRSLLEKL